MRQQNRMFSVRKRRRPSAAATGADPHPRNRAGDRARPGYGKGVIELDAPVDVNVRRVAKAKGVAPSALTVLFVDRPRHETLVAAVRSTGASVQLIPDGDVIGAIRTASPEKSGIDLYIG